MTENAANRVTITINGQAHSHPVEGRSLLVDFIRKSAGLTGTHVGCDTSQCGACTVILTDADGTRRQVKSCAMLAWEADGAQVTTIEGMADKDGTLSRMQRAFHLHHGLQCGFCTPGMIVSATALLATNPRPTADEIRHHLEGNICRCTGYHNIIKAVLAAADPDDPLHVTTQASNTPAMEDHHV